MKCFYAFLLTFFAVTLGYAQVPFRADGTLKNHSTGSPEAGVKIEIIQGNTLASSTSASSGRYDLKANVDFSKPFTVKFSKSGFASKIVAYDFSKMNPEDAPAGEIRLGKGDASMIPKIAGADLAFLESQPVVKWSWDGKNLEPAFDNAYWSTMQAKIDNVISAAQSNSGADDAKYNALIAEADALYNQSKWEDALAKYEASLQYKPTEPHPNNRIDELDKLILAAKKAAIEAGNADSEYLNLIKAADMLRDQKKYEQAILKYEEALTKKDEDYPEEQVYALQKIVDAEKKYKDAITQGDAFFLQKSWLGAKEKYTLANKLKPEEPHPIARLAEIAKKEGEINAAADKKKKYEDALAAGDAAFTAEKWAEAKTAYQLALSIESGSTYAEERVKACDIKIAELAAAEAKKAKITKLLEEGNTLFGESKWVESKAKYNAVLAEDAENTTAQGRIVEIDAKIKEAADLAANKAKFDKLVADGDALVKTTKWTDAKAKYEEAIAMQADPAVQTKLDNVNKEIQKLADKDALEKQFQELKTAGMALAGEEKWAEAKTKLTDAQAIKTDPQITAKLAEIAKKELELNAAAEKKKKFDEAFATAELAFNSEKWVEAKTAYELASTFDPTNSQVKDQIKVCETKISENAALIAKQQKIAKLLEEGNTLFTQSKWAEAKVKYEAVLVEDTGNATATSQLAIITTKIQEAADFAANKAKFDKLVADGDAFVKTTKWTDAKGKYEEAIAMQADPAVQTKLDNVNKELQKLLDKEELEKQFQQLKTDGLALATEEKWLEAKSKLTEANGIKVDPQVTTKLAEIETIIKANEAALKAEQEYLTLMEKAGQKELSKSYDEAIVLYKEASAKKPTEQQPKDKIIELEALKKANAANAEIDKKYNDFLNKGKSLMENKQYLDAIKEFNNALGVKPQEPEPVALAAQCEELERAKGDEEAQLIENILVAAQKKFDEKDLTKSKELANRYLSQQKKLNEAGALELLSKIATAEKANADYAAKMVEAEKLATEKKYELAINAFQEAKLIKPDETKPQSRIDEITTLQGSLASAAEKEKIYQDFMQKGDLSERSEAWEQALINYQSALNTKPGDKPAQDKVNAIQAKINEIANKEKSEQEKQDKFNKFIQEADDLFASENYLSAKSKYESALGVIPSDAYAIKQVAESELRERLKGDAAFEAGYVKIINKADENFDLKDYEKAKEYYQRAMGIKPNDPYPAKRLKEIEAIQNPPELGSVNLEDLGVPYVENSIMDGQALLLQAEADRKNLHDKKVEGVVDGAIANTNSLAEVADQKQVKNTTEIENVVSQVSAQAKEGDEHRKAIVEALRVADEENQLLNRADVEYKEADLLRSQDQLDIVESNTAVDYSVRDEVYGVNNEVLHLYEGALQTDQIAKHEGEQNESLQNNQELKKVQSNLEETDILKVERQMKNEGIVLTIAESANKSTNDRSDEKGLELLENESKIEVVTNQYAEKFVADSKNAPTNNEKIVVNNTILTDAEKIRSEAFSQRTSDNNQELGGVTIKLSEDNTNRDNNRQENVEIVKENETNIIVGKQEKFEAENLKYLKNKNTIDLEDSKKKDIVDKDENQVAQNIKGVENRTILAKDNLETRGMSDDVQRQGTRAGIEIKNADAENFSKNSTDKQHESNEKVKNLGNSISADVVNKGDHKKEELLAAQAKISSIDGSKQEKVRIKNALGEEYPEGVSQESFTQNDENGIVKALITRRVVVTNGEGNVYVRTQTLHATTYTKNGNPITEQHWNNETMGANLVKNY